jgi:nucleoside triphosphatase
MEKDYTNGIEVVAIALIVNDDNKILLIKSHKWGDVYLMPGGHVENGERIADAAKREGEEETGLKLETLYCVSAGELIGSPNFQRKAHFVYFYFVCEAISSEVHLDERELDEFIWIEPQQALKLNLAEGVGEVIENYINGVKINLNSD